MLPVVVHQQAGMDEGVQERFPIAVWKQADKKTP
jgi:hypothetical protein